MKTRMRKSLLAIICLLSSISASAYDFTVDGMYYKVVSLTDLTCSVTYGGESSIDGTGEYTGDIVIPETVTYNNRVLTVTSIGDYAFRCCSGLTSVSIPESVTSIGSSAFYGCSGLIELYSLNPIPPSVGSYNFTNAHYLNMNVYVPYGALSAYQEADEWKNFWNLQEGVPAGVESINSDGKNATGVYYDIQGRRLDAPKKGLNIINGKKVLIKK